VLSPACGIRAQTLRMEANIRAFLPAGMRSGEAMGRSSATGSPRRSITIIPPSAASRTNSEVWIWSSRTEVFRIMLHCSTWVVRWRRAGALNGGRHANSRGGGDLRQECGPRVKSGQRPVHGGYRAAVFPGQQHKVRVSDLPMPGDSRGWHVEIRSIVRPEFVAREGGNGSDQMTGGFRGCLHAGAQVEAQERALRDGARCKPVPLEEPCRRARVQTVLGRGQCDEDIGVEQVDLTLRQARPTQAARLWFSIRLHQVFPARFLLSQRPCRKSPGRVA